MLCEVRQERERRCVGVVRSWARIEGDGWLDLGATEMGLLEGFAWRQRCTAATNWHMVSALDGHRVEAAFVELGDH